MISPELLEILACPRCDSRPPLAIDGERLVCTLCRWRYRVEDGVPNLIAEEAEPPEGENGD